MRRIISVLLLVVAASACATASDPQGSSTVTTSVVGSVDSGIPPQLVDHQVRQVQVGDRTLTLAIADSPALRAQGLMGVTGLDDLDGMLFYWRHDASGGFWMKDTLIPLDIVWFLGDGTYAGRASMEPCTTDQCPTYDPGPGLDYRFAIEANPGDLDWVDESTVLVYSD